MRKKRSIVIFSVILLLGLLIVGGIGGLICEKNWKTDKEKEITQIEEIGNSPIFSSDIHMDILTRHALPKLERMQKEDQIKLVDSLQVMKKIEQLSIQNERFLYPEWNLLLAEEECAANQIRISNLTRSSDRIDISDPTDLSERAEYEERAFSELQKIIFEGKSSSELQKIIDENVDTVIEIRSEYIEVTESIRLKSNTYLIGNGVDLIGKGVTFLFLADAVEHILIDSVRISGEAEYGIYVIDSEKIVIRNSVIQGLTQKPICLIGQNRFMEIQNNIFRENGAGGIWISGNASYCQIEKNTISDNYGTSNWMAGIVLTNVKSQDSMNLWETFDDAHHFPQKENLYAQTECPHEIIIRGNKILGNQASGIYFDGAYFCYIVENQVKENDKEGICLDYGTIGCYLKENIFDGNGERKRQTDEDLRMDFVLDAGRMENGSAKSKLPGVSLDNTAYNILENNIVIHNFGGGIKMVRTTVRSLIIENIIKDNNKGQNDVFHFFGIEVGAAIADVEAADMDFTPDYENIICRNMISGDHYSGVFIGEECYVNDVFDNVIMEPQMFAIEAISLQFNSIVNNLSNIGVRNEYQ